MARETSNISKKIRVLIADDDGLFRETLKRLLDKQSSIEIVGEAADGKQAIEKTEELSPNVVLMDISMPEMNGLEATRCLKKLHPLVSVVIVSVHGEREYQIEAERAGADKFLLKRDLSAKSMVKAIKNVH